MAFDIKKFLAGDMKFSEAEVAEMLPKFTAERVTTLEAGVVSAADRKAIEDSKRALAASQAELDKKSNELNAEMAEWATMTAAEQKAATVKQERINALEASVLAHRQQLTTFAELHGVDPKTVLPTEGAPVVTNTPAKPVTSEIDPKKFVQIEHFGPLMKFAINLPAELQYIAQQHFDLFGKHLDTRPIVAEVNQRAAKGQDANVEAVWEELHHVPDRRAEKAKKEHDTEIAAAEARGEERARTAAALPSGSAPGRHAPVFGNRGVNGDIAPRTSALKRPQPEAGIRSAAAALASGKYRQKAS